MFSGQKLYIEDKWEPWSLLQRPGFPPGVPPPNGTQPASLPGEVGGDQFRLAGPVGGLQTQRRPQGLAGHGLGSGAGLGSGNLGLPAAGGQAVGNAIASSELARLACGRGDTRSLAGVDEIGVGLRELGVEHEDSLWDSKSSEVWHPASLTLLYNRDQIPRGKICKPFAHTPAQV